MYNSNEFWHFGVKMDNIHCGINASAEKIKNYVEAAFVFYN